MNQEEEFARLVPVKSVLGREWEVLKREREKQRQLFELASDKMAYNTSPYRQSNSACERFLSELLPRIRQATKSLDQRAVVSLEDHQKRSGAELGRKETSDVWCHFVFERIRKNISREKRKRMKSYHPGVYAKVILSLRSFRLEIKRWLYGGSHPFDGSQAMNAMFQAILQLHLLECAND